jgi:serine/threonine-protein kinase RsbT
MSAAPVVLADPPAEEVVIAAGLIEAVSRDEGEDPADADAVVAIGSLADLMTARQRGRELAARLGFSPCDQMKIASTISELASNILAFASLGCIVMTPVRVGTRLGVVIEARDEGPGIADLAKVAAGASMGVEPGFGLSGVRCLMDEFDIESEVGKGTRVTAKKWQRPGGGSDCPTAP